MRASRGEIKVQEILEEAGLDFQMEYIFSDLVSSSGRPLRFDFAVFDDTGDIDFLIEVQGEQHYQPKSKFGGKSGYHRQHYNDTQKKQYCAQHGYTLVCIPYWELQYVDLGYILKAAGY